MRDLDPEARRVLELAQAARTPNRDDKERIARRLAVAVSASAAATLSASAAHAATGGAVGKWSAIIGASKLCVCAGTLLAAALTGYVMVSKPAPTRVNRPTLAAAPSTATGITVQPAPGAAAQTPPHHAVVAAPIAQASAPTGEPSSAQPASGERRAEHAIDMPSTPQPARNVPGSVRMPLKPSDRSTQRPAAPNAASSSDALDSELDLLHRAQLAWRERDAANALRLLKQHRARYPRSALQLERDTLQVLTLCELGQRTQATRLARSLLASAAHSPLRASLEESCALK